MDPVAWAVSAVVVHFLYRLAWHLAIQFYVYFHAAPRDIKQMAGTDWAAVTGATDGIGKAYAAELAKAGFNVLLISRTRSRLERARDQIAAQNPNVTVDILVFDFSTSDPDEYREKLFEPLAKVGFLVNNVGHAPDFPEYLHRIPGGMETNRNTTVVNCLSAVMMCQMAVEHMNERNRGVIVNIGSSAASHTFFYWSTYSASKKFLHHFTDCLRCEYPALTFQNLSPGWVVAGVPKDQRPWKVLSPEEYAESAIRTVGLVENTRGHWAHQLDFDVTLCLPTPIVNFLLGNMLTARQRQVQLRPVVKVGSVRSRTSEASEAERTNKAHLSTRTAIHSSQ